MKIVEREINNYVEQFGSETQKKKLKMYNQYAEGGVSSPASGHPERIPNQEANGYAENKQPFKGMQMEGRLMDNGDYVVFSYGYYPLWFWCQGEGKWYCNSTKLDAATERYRTFSRPVWEPEMLPLEELMKKMCPTAGEHYDLGGLMVKPLYPAVLGDVPTDNTTIAHGNSTNLTGL
jgi:hypothetical protein